MHTTTPRLLLVDDHPILLKAFATALRRKGYEVATASDGLDALEKIRTLRPDLVFLDMKLPRMMASDVLKRLAHDATLPSCKIVVVSNSSVNMTRAELTKLGAAGVYVKANHSLKELCEITARHLAKGV